MSVKSELLKTLEEHRGQDVSGQELANTLGVSRNAVWKAIKNLQEEGYRITTATNRGYRLERENDIISAEGIANYISSAYKNLPVYVFDSIDSTNDEAKRRLAAGEKGNILVVAKEQTNGHGRRGRSFYSPMETGIYMSLLVHTDAGIEDAVSITTATSVFVAETIMELTGKQPQIKWVNDIYLDGKKICGILTEAILSFESGELPAIIVGVGINISTGTFPEELQKTANCLGALQGVTRNEMIAAIAQRILIHSQNVRDYSYLERYRKYSMVIGKEILYTEGNEMRPAKAVEIDNRGGLVIETTEGEQKTLSTGEISVRVVEK